MVKRQGHATADSGPCYQELKAALPTTRIANCDEAATKQGSQKAWIWTAVTALCTVFVIALTGAASVIRTMLGASYSGTISTDRCGAYNAYNKNRQIGSARLKRDFQAMIDSSDQAECIGLHLMLCSQKKFDHWHDYRGGKIGRAALKHRITNDARMPTWQLLKKGLSVVHGPTRTLCQDLIKRWAQL